MSINIITSLCLRSISIYISALWGLLYLNQAEVFLPFHTLEDVISKVELLRAIK